MVLVNPNYFIPLLAASPALSSPPYYKSCCDATYLALSLEWEREALVLIQHNSIHCPALYPLFCAQAAATLPSPQGAA